MRLGNVVVLVAAVAAVALLGVLYLGVTVTEEAPHAVLDRAAYVGERAAADFDFDAEADALRADLPQIQPSAKVLSLINRLNVEHKKQRVELYRGKKLIDGPDGVNVFFTAACTQQMLWQSFALENSWQAAGHPGVITRLVHGCISADGEVSPNHERALRKVVDPAKSFVFFTPAAPDASKLPLARAVAVWHWLKTAKPPERVLCLVDTDSILLKPLYHYTHVSRGVPYAQHHEHLQFDAWLDAFADRCASVPYSGSIAPLPPCRTLDKRKFAVGPPLMMHSDDWSMAAVFWIRYAKHFDAALGTGLFDNEAATLSAALARLAVSPVSTHITWERAAQVPAFPPLIKPGRGLSGLPLTWLPTVLHYPGEIEIAAPSVPAAVRKKGQSLFRHEDDIGAPLFDYLHFSKYRVPSDWRKKAAASASQKEQPSLLSCSTGLLFEFPDIEYMLQHHTPRGGDRGWQVFFAGVVPAINGGLAAYKKLYCRNPNLFKVWRTAADGPWHSHFLLHRNATSDTGFVVERVPIIEGRLTLPKVVPAD
ncbi:hypothetical protein DIPPA_33218 [Diplonema papillatum]|nr:hypothetical protein DIPPA_30879 [Diplonema papillatum]KAJ9473092.1 hypothetical protein DIPPA_33218 [Diplonema papillatum]